ncbi:aminoglycoside 6-adenylyltransferase [Staphylococcus simiae]|uniref:Putative aminoglycoside adenyltransferase n=1 Tax=Staphylococcus simiae CCM 7213 = CCUG 51256 TaxID=911238 RepID=G5JL29_9STAP|nr:aminoglycoside 6-adenylyltransferase [Staphylococcus simiae]EHJ07116.1 putative aminoglycoside adenyltransferase [Staphylococcus simiae CCM 7213 = CCUG 51256]PNZ09408.1 aminoglycoside adenylyltransferase [Staphylococcus simiae]SNV60403.1 aminoglycoside adenyltransferase [Staphylococcus simiae]
MSNDSDIYDLILTVAKNNIHIKGVYLNGSRANPFVWDDEHQDFDIVFVVDNVEKMITQKQWINEFGTILIKQIPKEELLYPVDKEMPYSVNLLLSNFKRLDLTVIDITKIDCYLEENQFAVLLFDKGYHLPTIDEPTDQHCWVKVPSQQLFDECLDEFYLMALNVLKGLWRKHLIYAMDYFDICRKMVLLMWSWDKSDKYNFEVNMGKHLKYLHNYLDINEQAVLRTFYPKFKEQEILQALITMVEYFDELSKQVSNKLEFIYKEQIVRTIKMHIKTLIY